MNYYPSWIHRIPPRKVNKLAMTALRLAAERQAAVVDEALLLDATAEALL